MEEKVFLSLKNELKQEIRSLLGFWEKFVFCGDDEKVFYGKVDSNLVPYPNASKHVVLTTRLIWTFSYAYRVLGEKNYKELAQRVYNYFMKYFIDKKHGGAFWELNSDGVPLDMSKRTYGEAFAIYALTEYYRAFEDKTALDEAINIYSCLESYAYDREYKGYYEAFTPNWDFEPEKQISSVNPYKNACKTMNTHLHLLEAYTSLLRVWRDNELIKKLKEQMQVMVEKIVDNTTWHYRLYFDRVWNSLTADISYGHDIEGSWLLWEAAECIGDEELSNYIKHISIKMAEAVFNEGWHENGGIIYELEPGGKVIKHRSWWVQAEAMVGFFNAWQLTKEDKYMDAVLKMWDFIQQELIDRKNGGWYAFAISDGIKANRADGWICPYHNGRMCFEIVDRIKRLENLK